MEYTGNSCSRRGCFVYYEFYIDQFAAEQVFTGYLLLAVCVRLRRREVSWKRIAAGSVVNAVFAAAFVCMGIPQGAIAGMIAAGVIVFGGKQIRPFVEDLLMLLFVTMCFAGVLELVLALVPLPVSIGSAAAAGVLQKGWKTFAEKRRLDGRLLSVRLSFGECTKELTAIWDTGNQLTEPLTGGPVSIVEAEAVSELLGENWEMRRGFFMIPYHSLGTEKSWMRGVAIDRLEVLLDGEKITVERPVFALYEGKVSSTEHYQVILHPKHSGGTGKEIS